MTATPHFTIRDCLRWSGENRGDPTFLFRHYLDQISSAFGEDVRRYRTCFGCGKFPRSNHHAATPKKRSQSLNPSDHWLRAWTGADRTWIWCRIEPKT